MTESQQILEFYSPEISRQELKSLTRRNNTEGLTFFLTWVVACVFSGAWVVRSTDTPWLIFALLVHGALLSFSYAASHECAHGTAFKSRWLNETVFWITSLVFGQEPIYRRYSHTSHHSFTWFRGRDAQMPYHNPMSFSQYVLETAGIMLFWENISLLVSHSFGRVSQEVKEFVPAVEIPRMQLNSIIFLLIYGSCAAAGLLLQSALPFLLYFMPRAMGGWLVNLYINTQHMCMQEGITDHRYTTRSVRCNKLSRWLYWNMNFHIEHHLFPMVPFHGLAKLHARISPELPTYTKGVLGANIEIIKLIFQQRTNPNVAASPRFCNESRPHEIVDPHRQSACR